jgi:hypothetical protein
MLLAFESRGEWFGCGFFAHAWEMASCALGRSLRYQICSIN